MLPITADIPRFKELSGLGTTTIYQMIRDGRLAAVRVGRKKLMIVIQSYVDLLAKQQAEGMVPYSGTERALEMRMANRAAKKQDEKVRPTLDDLGL